MRIQMETVLIESQQYTSGEVYVMEIPLRGAWEILNLMYRYHVELTSGDIET